ncbi:DUF397 domain-containing protein [Streptomyces sp. NPDC094034]|uniref:DUF397 domain-containing protein n=1 Tax=Streptomyces sp. NPDC094034 TaxID=3155309 RepID=UPI0033175FAA
MMTEPLRWSKSSYSDNGGQCIEVAANLASSHGVVPIRDSKNPSGPTLNVQAGAFASFVAGIKAGTLDTI